jgi:hypothetical protein
MTVTSLDGAIPNAPRSSAHDRDTAVILSDMGYKKRARRAADLSAKVFALSRIDENGALSLNTIFVFRPGKRLDITRRTLIKLEMATSGRTLMRYRLRGKIA